MKKFLFSICFMSLISLNLTSIYGEEKKTETAQPDAEIVITYSGNELSVKNVTPGSSIDIYTVFGVKVLSIPSESANKETDLNLPKGYYLVRVGNVVKKLVIIGLIVFANLSDRALGKSIVKDAAIWGFIFNETISLLENAGLMGLPLPKAFSSALSILKVKSGDILKESLKAKEEMEDDEVQA